MRDSDGVASLQTWPCSSVGGSTLLQTRDGGHALDGSVISRSNDPNATYTSLSATTGISASAASVTLSIVTTAT